MIRPILICIVRGRLAMTGNGGKAGISGIAGYKHNDNSLQISNSRLAQNNLKQRTLTVYVPHLF